MTKKEEEQWDRSMCTYCHPKPTNSVDENGFWSSQCSYTYFCESLYSTLYSNASGYRSTAQLLTDLYERSKIDGTVVARENNYIIFECLLKDKDRFGKVVNFQQIGEEGDPNRPYSFIYSAAHSQEYEKLRRKIRPSRPGYTGYSSFGNSLQQRSSGPVFKQPQKEVKESRTIHGPLFSYEEDVMPSDPSPENFKRPATDRGTILGTSLTSRGRPFGTTAMLATEKEKKFMY